MMLGVLISSENSCYRSLRSNVYRKAEISSQDRTWLSKIIYLWIDFGLCCSLVRTILFVAYHGFVWRKDKARSRDSVCDTRRYCAHRTPPYCQLRSNRFIILTGGYPEIDYRTSKNNQENFFFSYGWLSIPCRRNMSMKENQRKPLRNW